MLHTDLDLWKDSVEFVSLVYEITAKFPKEERFGLVDQIRRAAVSIPSNIAEGAGRNHKNEFIQYLHISSGSISELETQLIISYNLKFLDKKQLEFLINKITKIRSQIFGLIKSLKNR